MFYFQLIIRSVPSWEQVHLHSPSPSFHDHGNIILFCQTVFDCNCSTFLLGQGSPNVVNRIVIKITVTNEFVICISSRNRINTRIKEKLKRFCTRECIFADHKLFNYISYSLFYSPGASRPPHIFRQPACCEYQHVGSYYGQQ